MEGVLLSVCKDPFLCKLAWKSTTHYVPVPKNSRHRFTSFFFLKRTQDKGMEPNLFFKSLKNEEMVGKIQI